MKICIIGHLACNNNEEYDGQTIKTRAIFEQLKKKYGDNNITIIDTYGWKKHLFGIIRSCLIAVKKVDHVIVIPASRSARLFIPLLTDLKRRHDFKIHHILIGSRLYKITARNAFLRKRMRKVDYIYTENNSLIEQFKMQGIKNVYYMPNFKDLKKSICKKGNKHVPGLRCCILSRIEAGKGILDAVRVVDDFNKNNDNKIRLDIYGKIKDSFKKTFDLAIRENEYIKYNGIVQPNESVSTIEKYDLLLFPTRYKTEGIPGTIIDAFFAGVPVLASKWENFNEIIKEGKTGFGYSFGDINDFSKKLNDLAHNKGALTNMDKACLGEAEKYSPLSAMKVLCNNLNRKNESILLYIDSMHKGGAERVMSIIANHLAGNGYRVILATDVIVKKDEKNYSVSDKVKCVWIRPKSSSFIMKNAQRMKQLRGVIKTEKVDTVLSFLGKQNYRMLFSTIGLKCKKCVSVRNDPKMEYGKSWFSKWLANRVFSLADACIFQTTDEKKYFCKKIQKKSIIIPNPINEKFFNVKRSRNPKNVITVGRLEPQKNQRLLIDAFALIADKIGDEKLLIFGMGSLKRSLQEYIKDIGMYDRIVLMGEVNKIEKELAKARLFVLSSDYEGMPNSLMEAMAVGVPCISTDCPCGGPRELIKEDKYGILVPCNDVIKISNAMLTMLRVDSSSSVCCKVDTRSRMVDYRVDAVIAEWKKVLLESDR